MKINKSLKILFLILLVALALRVYKLDDKEFGTDEEWTLEHTSQILEGSFFENAGTHAHPPLFYTIISPFWALSNHSIMLLRSLMVLFSLISISLVFFIGRKFFGENISLLAAALLAFSPFHLMYSQHLRSYIFIMSIALIAIFVLYNFLKTASKKSLALLTFLYICLFYLHTLTAFFVVSQFLIIGILLLAKKTKVKMKHVFISGVITIVGWLFWLPIFMQQFTHNITDGAIKTLTTLNPLHIPNVFYKYAVGVDVSSASQVNSFFVFGLALILILLMFFGCFKLFQKSKLDFFIWCGSLFLPIIGLAIVGVFFPIFSFRYVSYLVPIFMLLVAKGFLSIPSKKTRSVLILVTFIIWFLILKFYWVSFVVVKWGHNFAL
tara:strand:- start:3074 stop:4213 length:1140 start_codon:yes stop_codon:yes gene_type:complete